MYLGVERLPFLRNADMTHPLVFLIVWFVGIVLTGLSANKVLIDKQDQLSDHPIHPHCLDAVIRAGGDLVAIDECEERKSDIPVSSKQMESPVNGNQLVWYTSHFKPTEHDPDPGFTGFIMTQNALRGPKALSGPKGDTLFLSHYHNGGGSGTFFSLVAYSIEEHDGITYGRGLMREVVGSGDRCNDGYVEFADITDQKIYWSHAATHFRLLNPLDTTDWRSVYRVQKLMPEIAKELETPLTFSNWNPYEDLSNSASDCVGRILKSFNYETREYELVGVMINKSDFVESSRSTASEKCSLATINSVSTEPSQHWGEFVTFSKEQWLKILEQTAKKCSTDPLIPEISKGKFVRTIDS